MWEEKVAIRIFSDFLGQLSEGWVPHLSRFSKGGNYKGQYLAKRCADEVLPTQSRLPKLGRRPPISIFERSTEMTMAGKPKLQTQSSKVFIF